MDVLTKKIIVFNVLHILLEMKFHLIVTVKKDTMMEDKMS